MQLGTTLLVSATGMRCIALRFLKPTTQRISLSGNRASSGVAGVSVADVAYAPRCPLASLKFIFPLRSRSLYIAPCSVFTSCTPYFMRRYQIDLSIPLPSHSEMKPPFQKRSDFQRRNSDLVARVMLLRSERWICHPVEAVPETVRHESLTIRCDSLERRRQVFWSA